MMRINSLPLVAVLLLLLLLLLSNAEKAPEQAPKQAGQEEQGSSSTPSKQPSSSEPGEQAAVLARPAPEPPIDTARELGVLSRLIKSEIASECTQRREDYFYRSLDGTCNWLHPGESEWGKAGSALMRDNEQYSYKDGIGEPRDGPNARELSNIFFKRNEKIYFEHTSVLVGVVEFVIHDIITTSRSPTETITVPVPKCDEYFDKKCEGNKTMTMWRSSKVPGTGTNFTNPRETMNNGTTWLDLSPIYGNSVEVNRKLRTMTGGKLLTQKGPDGGDYPPFNSMGLPMNAYKHQSQGRQLFAAGDPRSNQDWLLLAAHVLLMRNHNRFCDMLAQQHPDWDDEKLFQYARHLNIAHYATSLNSYMSAYFTDEMPFPKDDGFALFRQWYNETVITMNPYHTYPWEKTMVRGKPLVASQELAIGYRFHDLIPEELPLINEKGEVMEMKRVANTTFDASGFMDVGIDAVLRGMAFSTIPNFHSGVSEDYRSAWISYAVPEEGFGYDMVAWTIIQERERGLPPFNEYFRRYPGKVPVKIREKFEDFTSDPRLVKELKRLYRTPDDVDFTVGLQLDEEYFPGTTVPRTQLITSLFSLFGVGTADRFCVAYSVTACLLAGKPWDCTPLNPVDEVLWEPFPNPIFPRARWASAWFDELDITNGGMYGVWSLITKNSNVKCVQLEPLWPVDPETNPVVCSLPKTDSTLLFYGIYTVLIAVVLYTTIKCCVRRDSGKKKKAAAIKSQKVDEVKEEEKEKSKQQPTKKGANAHRT